LLLGDHTVMLKFSHCSRNMMIMSINTWKIYLVLMGVWNQIF